MLASWVSGADGSGFPAEHLPYGVFSQVGDIPTDARLPRVGVRIGDHVLDLPQLVRLRLLDGPFDQPTLNPFMAAGPEGWRRVRERLTELVIDQDAQAAVTPALVPLADCRLHLPIEVGDYVDFYASIEHATNMGRMFRPDGEPLLPNWRHLPVAYHGRSGTIVVSGAPVIRPSGPLGPGRFGPSKRLDIELEVGFVVGVPSNHGEPVSVDVAAEHIFGVALVNDWSARDIQGWEGQPLGPFLGKSFATSISAWITPLEALDGCRVDGPVQDPEPLPYLATDEPWALGMDLAVDLRPAGSSTAETVSRNRFDNLYWTFPQMVAHLTANGAHLRTGDLLASGTVSGPTRGTEGSLMELTRAGTEPLQLGDGVERGFLQDGDEVVLRGSATVADGVALTLGDVRGVIEPTSQSGAS